MARRLILPGLGGSGPGHWQRWWLSQDPNAEVVEQDDWQRPDLRLWLYRVAVQVRRHPGALLIGHSLGALLIPPPVAVVDAVVDKQGTRKVSEAYLNYLFTAPAQDIIAKLNFRPRDPTVLAKYAGKFPKIKTFEVEALLGPWGQVQKTHFDYGGVFDQIIAKNTAGQ